MKSHTMSLNVQSRRTPPWVRRRRILLMFVFLVLVLPFIIFSAARAVSERKFSGYLEAIRAEGLPASLEELEHWRGTITAPAGAATPAPAEGTEETAIDLYLEAAGILQSVHNRPTQERMAEIMERLDEEGCLEEADVEELGAHLSANQEVFTLLYQAAELPPGHYVLDYAQGRMMPLPHLSGIRWNVRVLHMDAVYAAFKKDPDRAYKALNAAMAVTRIVWSEPVLVNQLVRSACVGIIFDTMREVLGRVALNETQLARIQEWFASVYVPDAYVNSLVTERVFGIMAYKNPVLLAKDDEDWAREEYAAPIIEVATALGLYVREWDRYFTGIDKLITALHLPYAEAKAVCDRFSDRPLWRPLDGSRRHHHHRAPLPGLSRELVSFARLPDTLGRDQARSSIGVTAMALERYGLAAGTFPETLQVLVPEYLAAVPEDPFDRQPLRYQCKGQGYLVYSIGINGVDDGGVHGKTIGEGDITVQVER